MKRIKEIGSSSTSSYSTSSSDEDEPLVEKTSSCSTSSSDEDEPLVEKTKKLEEPINVKERFQFLQSSLNSTFDEYCKQFNDTEANLAREKTANKALVERNKKLEEDLNKALVERNKKLEEDLKMVKKLEESEKRLKELKESEKRLKEELKRAQEKEECSKKNLEQSINKLWKLSKTSEAIIEECDQLCNQGEVAPQPSKRRKYVVNDFMNCAICLEPWTHSGEHNVCSLSCGHFFGKSCITKWISRDESSSSSTCPVCSSRVTLSDIRHHYVS